MEKSQISVSQYGIKVPAFVYQVFEEWKNWYNNDFDLWTSITVENFNVIDMLGGEVTPAQLQEQAKQEFQNGLDAFFK